MSLRLTDVLPGRYRFTGRTALLLAGCLCFSLAVAAQQPILVADVNASGGIPSNIPVDKSTNSYGLLPDGRVLFAAHDDNHGLELWVSDGSVMGTVLLKDIFPGPGSSEPREVVAFDSKVFFSALHPESGRELWVSDGTAAGTQLYADIQGGEFSSDPSGLTPAAGALYFRAHDQARGTELRHTDGSGSVIVIDLAFGTASSYPEAITAAPGGAYFFALVDGVGFRAMFTAGTALSTVISDLEPRDGDFLVLPDERVVLTAVHPDIGHIPVAWDPMSDDSQWLISPTDDFFTPRYYTLAGGELYFSAQSPDLGRELFRWDLTAAPPVLVIDLEPGADDGVVGPMIESADGSLIFAGFRSATGAEPYRTQGSAATTELVADLIPGSQGSVERRPYFVRLNHEVQLVGEGPGGPTLFAINGASTTAVEVFPSDSDLRLATAGQTWGRSHHRQTSAAGIFTISAPAAAPIHVQSSLPSSSSPRSLRSGRGADEIVFAALDSRGLEPWAANLQGTAQILEDVVPGSEDSTPREILGVGSRVILTTLASQEPLVWDGQSLQVVDLEAGQGSNPRNLTPFQDQVLLGAVLSTGGDVVALDPVTGLWQGLGINRVPTTPMLAAGQAALILGDSRFLWSTDGTAAGTEQVSDQVAAFTTNVGSWGAVLQSQTENTDLKLVFAGEADSGREPYLLDGLDSEPVLLADLVIGAAGSSPRDFMAGSGGRAAFIAQGLGAGTPRQVFVTDGTTVTQVSTFLSSVTSMRMVAATESGWFFRDSRGGFGREYWFTDGTEIGTFCLDINPGPASSLGPVPVTVAADGTAIYFFAYTSARGYELWRSDGTPGGTVPLPEILPGPAGQASDVQTLWHAGVVYFPANGMDGKGTELWALNAEGVLMRDGFESGDTSMWSAALP